MLPFSDYIVPLPAVLPTVPLSCRYDLPSNIALLLSSPLFSSLLLSCTTDRNYTYYDAETRSFRVTPPPPPLQDVDLSGCQFVLPFPLQRLEHFLNASLLLAPDVNTIFVATGMPVALPKQLVVSRRMCIV